MLQLGGNCTLNSVCESQCCSMNSSICIPNSTTNHSCTILPSITTSIPGKYVDPFSKFGAFPHNLSFYIGLGCGVLLAIVAIVILIRKTNEPTDKFGDFAKTDVGTEDDSDDSQLRSNTKYVKLTDIYEAASLEEFKLDSDKLELDELIATGGYGTVWQGKYDGTIVAIKMLYDDRRTAVSVKKFVDEVKLMAKLSNPYIVRFLGASWTREQSMGLVVEYMNQGDLNDYLRRTTPQQFQWMEKRQCAIDVLMGLIYLHSVKVIHRDLKSRNVLLDTEKPCKLSDFGVSREVSTKTMSQEVGTYLWTAPEILRGDRYTLAADVYSFGVLLGELDSHKPPYHGLTMEDGNPMLGVSIMMKVMQNHVQVEVSPSCPPAVAEIVEACTQYDALNRPTAIQMGTTKLIFLAGQMGNWIDLSPERQDTEAPHANESKSAPVTFEPVFGIMIGVMAAVLAISFVLYLARKICKYSNPAVFEDDEDASIDSFSHELRMSGFGHLLSVKGKPEISFMYNFHDRNVEIMMPRLSTALDWRDLEQYRLEMHETKRIKRLARGGYGTVWLGTYKEQRVAIKTIDEGKIQSQAELQCFINEVKLMAKLQHSNIVGFIGACWFSLDAVNLIVEYMDMGDLKDHLDTRVDSFPWPEKFQCIAHVLRALVYLHGQRIIHRDLKSRNVLMDSKKPSKLSDFGISREIISKTMSHEVGTFLWAAPEILKGCQLTVAADIYSFGMLLSELDTHQVPFEGMVTEHGDTMVPMAIVMKVMQGNARVRPSKSCPRSIAAIMDACTQYDHALRPTAEELLLAVTKLCKTIKS